MDKAQIVKALGELKKANKERKFKQTYDLIFTLKGLDLKKPDQHVDFYAQMPKPIRNNKICALVGPELKDDASKTCDFSVAQTDFEGYDKKKAKKLAESYDYFIAQANIMGLVAKNFGKIFGPRGKMPNPKAGCVVPPKGSLANLYKKLQQTQRIMAKTQPQIQCSVGKEGSADEDVAENVISLYNQLVNHLVGRENNIKNIYLKLTMGKPVKVQ
jgi:large subunit ribosomal protein L1